MAKPVTDLSEYFGPDSPLARWLPGFKPRPGQAWMAEAVAEALDRRGQLVVEAGTGTGKTFAYLLPALLSGRKTIISTGTRALQDQLYHRDLPLVGRAVGRPVTTALLKGRANYLCLERLESVAPAAASPALREDLAAVAAWRCRTQTGDRAELANVAEDSGLWPLVTSTTDNCLGRECRFYEDCHVLRARRAAQETDLVVVNHHLLLADLALKEAGFIEFLPGAEAVILDEAHQIPDLAAQFFGVSAGSREIERLLEEIRARTVAVAGPGLARAIDAAHTAVRALRAAAPVAEGRHEFSAVVEFLREPLGVLAGALRALRGIVEDLGASSQEIGQLNEQLWLLLERLSLLAADDSWDGLRWLDVGPRSLRLNLTPLDVSQTLGGLFNGSGQAWIFTSATLAVGDDFSHFAGRMGLGDVPGVRFPSPYAIDRHGLVYLPRDLPPPADERHTAAMLQAVLPLLKMTRGGMFCLFTSHRALDRARAWLRRHRRRLAGRPLLVQGDAPRDELLQRFRAYGNAVLLGTGTFWEGVDVRGPALTIVAIDKLPFGSPADPLMMARLEFIRREGGNGFTEHQLPQAALALKQGAGRLLRDHDDFGVVVLCDPRVGSKRYGAVFLKSLEPMPVTDSADDVKRFLAAHEASPDDGGARRQTG